MAIFDDTFIGENVCSGLVVESDHRQKLHELILGAQSVVLNRTLQQHVDRIEEHNRDLRAKADAIPAAARGTLTVDAFFALAARDDIDAAIDDAERRLAAAKQENTIRTTTEFQPFGLPTIDLAALTILLERDLADLDRAAAGRFRLTFPLSARTRRRGLRTACGASPEAHMTWPVSRALSARRICAVRR